MKPPIWFNGELVPHEDATIHVLSHVVHYGSSVFEGIRCYKTDRGSAVFRLTEHMRRLVDSAKIHRMTIPYDLDSSAMRSWRRSAKAGWRRATSGPVVFRGHGRMGVNPLNNPVSTIIAVWEWGQYLGAEAAGAGRRRPGRRRGPAPRRTRMPAMAKAGGNYLGGGLIKMDAIKNGFAEGIALTVDGLPLRGLGREPLHRPRRRDPHAAGGVLDPPRHHARLDHHASRATAATRSRERAMPREALYIADEVFFTGTAAEVTPIRSVDHYTVGEGSRGPITTEAPDGLFDVAPRGQRPARLAHLPARARCGADGRRGRERHRLTRRCCLPGQTPRAVMSPTVYAV